LPLQKGGKLWEKKSSPSNSTQWGGFEGRMNARIGAGFPSSEVGKKVGKRRSGKAKK